MSGQTHVLGVARKVCHQVFRRALRSPRMTGNKDQDLDLLPRLDLWAGMDCHTPGRFCSSFGPGPE
jgi:hypothetical protein